MQHLTIYRLQTIQECYNCFEGFPYSKDNETVQLQDFQSFLTSDQDDPLGKDDRAVSTFLRDFVQDPLRDVQEPYLTIPEVIAEITFLSEDLKKKFTNSSSITSSRSKIAFGTLVTIECTWI